MTLKNYNEISSKDKSFLFELKEDAEGLQFLQITEMRHTATGTENHVVIVGSEDLGLFEAALKKTIKFANYPKKKHGSNKEDTKSNRFNEVRKAHKRAYMPWDEEEDDELTEMYCSGATVQEIAEHLGRNKGAINSRIKKIELKDKYG
jgi:hypothetical protein